MGAGSVVEVAGRKTGRTVPLYDQANSRARRVNVQLTDSGPGLAPSYDFSRIARALWGSPQPQEDQAS